MNCMYRQVVFGKMLIEACFFNEPIINCIVLLYITQIIGCRNSLGDIS